MQKHLLTSVFVSLALSAPASAKAIKIPEGKPQVSLDIPDDWTVRFDEAGLHATSPETNSFVFGTILKRPKADANKWVNEVLAKLQARGIVFKTQSKEATKPATPSAPPVAAPSLALTPVAPPSAAPAAVITGTNGTAAAVAPLVPAAPPEAKAAPTLPNRTIEPRKEAADETVAPPPKLTVPSLALLNEAPPLATPPSKGPHFPFHALPYKDTSWNGTPVDVELLTFILPDKSVFFLIQESGQTDPRVTDIINSVKPPA